MLPITGWAWRSRAAIQSFACLRFRQRGRSASRVRTATCRKVGGLARRFAASGSPPDRASRRFSNPCPRLGEGHQRKAAQPEIMAAAKDSRPLRQESHTWDGIHFSGATDAIKQCAVRRPAGDGADRRSAFPGQRATCAL